MDLKISIDYHEYFISSSCYTHFVTGKQQCNLIVNGIRVKFTLKYRLEKHPQNTNLATKLYYYLGALWDIVWMQKKCAFVYMNLQFEFESKDIWVSNLGHLNSI